MTHSTPLRFTSLILAAAAATASISSFASTDLAPLTKESIQKAFPFMPKADAIRQLPGSDLVEIRSGKKSIFYTDSKASFLIKGDLFEAETGTNITQDRISELSVIDFNSLNFNDAIKIVHGNGKRKLATFEDPNCGFCKKYTQILKNLDNVTVYVFLYPILGADSAEKSKNIWCAADKAKTYEGWMLKGEIPPSAACDLSSLDRNKAFGLEHSIRGTPATIFTSGKTIPGAIDAKRIEDQLGR